VVFGAVLMYNETFNLSSGYLRFSWEPTMASNLK
jgi:hypothetical protein